MSTQSTPTLLSYNPLINSSQHPTPSHRSNSVPFVTSAMPYLSHRPLSSVEPYPKTRIPRLPYKARSYNNIRQRYTMTDDQDPPPSWPPSNWQNGDYNMAGPSNQYNFGINGSTSYDSAPETSNQSFQSNPSFDYEMNNTVGQFSPDGFDPSHYTLTPDSRPHLALDTNFAGSQQSSAMPTDASAFDPEQLETPMYSDGLLFPNAVFRDAQMATVDEQPMYYQPPPHSQTQTYFQPQPHTISPKHLPQQQLHPNKSFGDIMMESRASSSSADGWSSQQEWPRPSSGPVKSADELKIEQRAAQSGSLLEFDDELTTDGLVDQTRVAEQVRQYVNSPNRLAHGERSVIVMTPKVAQKSYGTEKRYLCPQPQAVFVGKSWWTSSSGPCPAAHIAPPMVNIALLGEEATKDVQPSWTAASGEDLTDRINNDPIRDSDNPLLGKAAGKNLHISNQDGKRRKVHANVTVKIPPLLTSAPDRNGKASMSSVSTMGVFESKEIKVISKPSKKRSNTAKAALGTGELNVLHGSTVSLFNRVRAQTSSTRYMAVEPRLDAAKGSDGKPFPNVVSSSNPSQGLQALTADPVTWESFIIWLVDPTRSSRGWAPSMVEGYPSTPVNAILQNFTHPICYNNTVVLQSLTTGVVTPTLVVRRVEQASVAIGSDGMGEAKRYCPPGEFQGDPVSQLHKIALEIYNPADQEHIERDRRFGGQWVVCVNEEIKGQAAQHERQWTNRPEKFGNGSPPVPRSGADGLAPGTITPTSPGSSGSSFNAANGGGDYFGRRPSSSSIHPSPIGADIALPMTEGGPVRRQRTHSSGKGPFGARPLNRKRSSADGLAEMPSVTSPEGPKQSWAIDVTDMAVWSIVSTEQTTYTFFVPPGVKQMNEPVTPVASLTRYIPPGQAAETRADDTHQYTSLSRVPLITYYGHGFRKGPDGQPVHRIYYGAEEASHHEYRCGEVVAASEPSDMLSPLPVSLVRADGQCIFPTTLTYPPEIHRF